jgi:hypothetical protein
MKSNLIKSVITTKEPKRNWLQRFSVRVRALRSRRAGMGVRRELPLTGAAGALAALDRLYAQNAAGMKRLADR